MSFTYLHDKAWHEITREERFYCCKLFGKMAENPVAFTKWLISSITPDPGMIQQKIGEISPPVEVAFEECFYRDYNYSLGRSIMEDAPQKRTFDFCIFLKAYVIIIEAKVQQGYTQTQLDHIATDRKRFLPQYLKDIPFSIFSLHSSHYQPKDETKQYFDGWITWKVISGFFNNDPFFLRADSLYNQRRKGG